VRPYSLPVFEKRAQGPREESFLGWKFSLRLPFRILRSAGRDFRSCPASLDAMYAQTNFLLPLAVIHLNSYRKRAIVVHVGVGTEFVQEGEIGQYRGLLRR